MLTSYAQSSVLILDTKKPPRNETASISVHPVNDRRTLAITFHMSIDSHVAQPSSFQMPVFSFISPEPVGVAAAGVGCHGPAIPLYQFLVGQLFHRSTGHLKHPDRRGLQVNAASFFSLRSRIMLLHSRYRRAIWAPEFAHSGLEPMIGLSALRGIGFTSNCVLSNYNCPHSTQP